MIFSLLFLAVARADTYHDQPDPSKPGGIVGVVSPAARLQAVVAVDPYAFHAYEAGVNPATGRFKLKGLPAGEYDLLIKTTGHLYEGLTLEDDPAARPPAATLDRIAHELGKDLFTSEDYFNVQKIVRLASDGQTAKMLLIRERTKSVVDPGGRPIRAIIRRFDLCAMVKTNQVWQITHDRHLLRQQVPYKSPDAKLTVTYSPKLSGKIVGDALKDVGTIDLDKLPVVPLDRFGHADHAAP